MPQIDLALAVSTEPRRLYIYCTGSGVCALKKVTERCWPNLMAHIGAAVTTFDVLVNWFGKPELAVARFSL